MSNSRVVVTLGNGRSYIVDFFEDQLPLVQRVIFGALQRVRARSIEWRIVVTAAEAKRAA